MQNVVEKLDLPMIPFVKKLVEGFPEITKDEVGIAFRDAFMTFRDDFFYCILYIMNFFNTQSIVCFSGVVAGL